MAKFADEFRSAFYQGFMDQDSFVFGSTGPRIRHDVRDIVNEVETKWSVNPCLLLTLPNHQHFLHLGKLSGRELNYGHIRTKKEIVLIGEFHYFHHQE